MLDASERAVSLELDSTNATNSLLALATWRGTNVCGGGTLSMFASVSTSFSACASVFGSTEAYWRASASRPILSPSTHAATRTSAGFVSTGTARSPGAGEHVFESRVAFERTRPPESAGFDIRTPIPPRAAISIAMKLPATDQTMAMKSSTRPSREWKKPRR